MSSFTGNSAAVSNKPCVLFDRKWGSAMNKTLWIVAVWSLFAALLPPPAQAANGQNRVAPPAACVSQLAEDFTNDRESKGLDGIVSTDQIKEFSARCLRNPAEPTTVQRDAGRCVNRYMLDHRTRNEGLPAQAEIDHIVAECKAVARATPAAGVTLAAFAREGGNIFTHARARPMFEALEPRGSSGAAPPVPGGRHQSQSDGTYAYTAVVARDLGITSLLVDLATNRAILCHSIPDGPDVVRTGRWNSQWFFDDQPMTERPGGCHPSLSEFAPSQLLNWRQHIVKSAAARPPRAVAASAHQTAVQQGAMPDPAAQQCILGKMTAYVRGRDLKGLDSKISPAQSAAFRAECGVPPEASGQSAIQQPGLLPLPPNPSDGRYRFSGHCNGFTLSGRDYHDAGPCPGGIELTVPTTSSNRPQKTRLTFRVPNPRAPVMTLDLTAATQEYGDNDIVKFVFTPITPLPFGWAATDGLECVFVKSPANGMARQFPKIQPSATLSCGFDESRLANVDKMRFGFFASSADIVAFRSAFIAAHDALNPGRPFVSPKPTTSNTGLGHHHAVGGGHY